MNLKSIKTQSASDSMTIATYPKFGDCEPRLEVVRLEGDEYRTLTLSINRDIERSPRYFIRDYLDNLGIEASNNERTALGNIARRLELMFGISPERKRYKNKNGTKSRKCVYHWAILDMAIDELRANNEDN